MAEVVTAGVDGRLSELYVARPGKVTAYDALTNTAVVKPMVKHALASLDDGERSYEELPEIPFVPIVFPRAGAHVVSLPVAVGDTVLLVFCDVSLAEWREGGGLSEPVDARRHSLGWPVAVPGFYPDNNPMSPSPLDLAARVAGMVLGEHAGVNRIEISSAGIKLGSTAVDPVAKSIATVAAINALQTQFAAVAAWVAANTASAWTVASLIATAPALAAVLVTGAVAVPAAALLVPSPKTFTT